MLKTVGKWLAAAALLCVTAGGVKAQDVTLPTQGTTEYNLSGSIVLDPENAWNVNGLWAPFVNPNLQWGIAVSVIDNEAVDTSGSVGAVVNWHFVPTDTASRTVPFIGAGVGTFFGDLDGTFFDLHGGVKFFLTSETSFNIQLQFLMPDEGDDIVQILFGLSIYRR